jgi:hypothetical protein
MKRFKNILYVLDEVSLSRQGSADKVAELARLNDARVTVLIAEEIKFFDDLSRQFLPITKNALTGSSVISAGRIYR